MPQWNKFEKKDRAKPIEMKVKDIILELETQAEFNFEINVLPKNDVLNSCPDWVKDMFKMLYVAGATFGIAKVLEKQRMGDL